MELLKNKTAAASPSSTAAWSSISRYVTSRAACSRPCALLSSSNRDTSLVLQVPSKRFLGAPATSSIPTQCESQLLGDRGNWTNAPSSAGKVQRSSGDIELCATTSQISVAEGENKKLIERGQKGPTTCHVDLTAGDAG
jgi:hypothetical protein